MNPRTRARRRHGHPWRGSGWSGGEWGPRAADRSAWMGGGRRMRRGDIRTALLAALAEGPAHGYELIGRLEEKSGGMWRPSPGSVYPTLQMFEDEGLVRSEERDGKRVYELTDAGRAEATERMERAGSAPWEGNTEAMDGYYALFKAGANLFGAAKQIARAGEVSHMEHATEVIRNATRELYQILAEE